MCLVMQICNTNVVNYITSIMLFILSHRGRARLYNVNLKPLKAR